MELAEPGWVLAECSCGQRREITTSEAITLQRAHLVRTSTLPAGPPIGPPPRPPEGRQARLRAMAQDLFRRGVIDEATYHQALARVAHE